MPTKHYCKITKNFLKGLKFNIDIDPKIIYPKNKNSELEKEKSKLLKWLKEI